MAVDVCSEISPATSPRISFSHDLKELDFVPVEPHSRRLDSSASEPAADFDFDFCVGGGTIAPEITSADELFADGKILPVQIREIQIARPGPVTPKPNPDLARSKSLESETANKKRLIEFLSGDEDAEERPPVPRAAFWQFRRSSSDNSRASGLLRSLQFLTRSNSTGSVPNPKPPKGVMRKQHSLKETYSADRRRNSASLPSINPYCHYNINTNCTNLSKKPSLRKSSSSRSYGAGNGVRVSPVLNIPPSYIAKGTVSLFGFGSFFCSKKSKKKRK